MKDRSLILFTSLTAFSIVGIFSWLVSDILINGIPTLSPEFILLEPEDSGRSGGIGPILVSTLLILCICLALSVPIALGTAIVLTEFTKPGSFFSQVVRRSLDILSGIPSIVFGLFGSAFFCISLGLGFSILAGGLTLSCMILPLLIRTTEEGLRSTAQHHRLSALALGISKSSTFFRVSLRVAAPSLTAGLILSIGRALAETAALLFTSGYVMRMPESVLDSGRTLSVHIFDLAMNVPGGDEQAYGSACILLIVLLLINSMTTNLSRAWGTPLQS